MAQRFEVDEDPRVEMIVDFLPGANCGACGSSGCVNLAEKWSVVKPLQIAARLVAKLFATIFVKFWE